MKKILVLNKKEGETPLEAIVRFKKSHPKYENLPATYAGRLDPMAEGLLIILTGEECKNKERYLKLSKTYEIEVLFGVQTDTYDILGKVHKVSKVHKVRKEETQKILKDFLGKFRQEYPAFSSKTVEGEPLFAYARGWTKSGRLPKKLPTRTVEIFSIKVGSIKKISGRNLFKNILKRIAKVKGDFRQKEILKLWKRTLKDLNTQFSILKIKVSCSSGTYMRTLAHELGEKMKIPALAYKIKRTKIGNFKKPNI